MSAPKLDVGDWVIYRKQKASACPGPRAQLVSPAPKGEEYQYWVDKYWVVQDLLENGDVVLRTRRGKTHTIKSTDSQLRRASWWERYLLRKRFPDPTDRSPTETR